VVMDEPNSNLDAEGDAALTAAIADLRRRKKTVIVMAHRASAIAAVDQLLMLRDGKQVAFGPKEEVLKEMTKPVPNAPANSRKTKPAAKRATQKNAAPQKAKGGGQSKRRVSMPSFSAKKPSDGGTS